MTISRLITCSLLTMMIIQCTAFEKAKSIWSDGHKTLLSIPSQQQKETGKNVNIDRIISKINRQDIKELIRKEFADLFSLEDKTIVSPPYLIGDVNGDRIDDLVAIVRVKDRVKETDLTKPSFWLGKPLGTGMSHKAYKDHNYFTIGDLARYKGDFILVILHGSDKSSKKRAHQYYKYALLDVMDNGVNKMSLQRKALTASIITNEREAQPPPKLIGMAVLLTVDDSGTAIYWDGERYRWYPVN